MNELQDRIAAEGKVIGDGILKVNTFMNNQVDPALMKQIGEEFAAHFADQGITKIATIESSGIAPALMTALTMNLPLIVFKKNASEVTNKDLLHTEVTSYTTGKSYEMTLPEELITENDHVLLIDDFLADGEAATGAIRLVRRAHATVAGIGILIEKSFQPGASKLKGQGFEVYSLAKIANMDNGNITFAE